MSAHVLGVVRSATQLDALTYEVSPATDPVLPWMQDHTCVLRPLARDSSLWSAWRALAEVTAWDATTLEHVSVILRETVPCIDVPDDLPALQVDVPAKPRATAAHPRAFRGTKYRPPRSKQPAPIDVRPYLLTRRHTDQVLAALGQPGGTGAAYDPAFVMQLLPLVRASSEVGAFAALARALELSTQPELRAALVGVFLAAPEHALGWWSYVLASDREDRLEVARLVSASGVAKLAPVETALGVTIATLPQVDQWSFYRGLVVGASPAYLLSGLALDAKLDRAPPGRVDVTELIESTVLRLDHAMDEDSRAEFWRGYLWELLGTRQELVELLASPEFVSLQAPAAFWLIRLANTPSQESNGDEQWSVLAANLPRITAIAASLPAAYQRKFVEDIGDAYWWVLPNVGDIRKAFASCVELCLRVAKPPFSTEPEIGYVLPALAMIYTETSEATRRAIVDAPDASWRALEDACKRANQALLLQNGINRLGQLTPALLVATFTTTPGALLHTADVLSGLSFEACATLLKRFAGSGLADPALANASIERLCEVVAPVVQAGGPNPIRRALREHLAGTASLSAAQLRGHRDRIIADLDIIRLAAIRQAAERALAARVGLHKIETSNVRHALAMLNYLDVNRRQLRRMLAASVTGDRDWKHRHPLSKQWFAHHPKIDQQAWLDGIELLDEITGVGPVTIAIERDPLEAIKLGTYVGSCLGRGGRFAYSAAAVVLDVNKQVVYARDAKGSVVGRQLLAISDADALVCFEVYGTVKPPLLEPLFREFDRRFAAKLELPLSGSDYEIATVLSQQWYDDGGALETDPA